MSGHSKWHNIAKRKGANDAKKAKIFKISRIAFNRWLYGETIKEKTL